MRRRSFIKRLFGVATAAVVSEKLIPDDIVVLHDNVRLPYDVTAAPLAPLKAEGSVMLYDDPLAPSRSGILTRSEFGKQLADSLNKAFEEAYADYEPDDWPKPG